MAGMRLVFLSVLFACGCTGSSGGVSDGGGDLSASDIGDLSTSLARDLATSGGGDIALQQTCNKSCGANQICVWFACNNPPIQGCVEVAPACRVAPSCGCFMCQTGTGECSSYQGQIACGPTGICG
jgi:hypothetical protein